MATKLGEMAIQVYVLPIMEFHVNCYTNLAFSGGEGEKGSASLLFIIRKQDPFCTDLFINALYLDSIM